MSAAPQPRTAPIVTRPRTQLRLVPTPTAPPAGRHDAAFATCLGLLLVVGVLAVLLLNTALQQQADSLNAQQRVVAQLALEDQSLNLDLERDADPKVLAARAKAMHMRPVTRIRFLAATPQPALAPGR